MSDDYFTSQYPKSRQPHASNAGQRNCSLAEAIEIFYQDELARGLLPLTVEGMRQFLDPMTGKTYGLDQGVFISDVSRLDITRFLQRRFDPDISKKFYSTSGRRNTIRQLKSFFKWAYESGLTDSFILRGMRPPRPDYKRIVPLTDLEIVKVFEVIHARKGLRIRNASIFSLMLDTGLRRSEISRLKKSDLDLDARTVHAYGKKKERLVGFGARTSELLKLYAGHSRSTRPGKNNDHLFLHRKGTPMTDPGVTGLFNQLKKPTGIKRLNAHITRHTFATRFLQRGGDPFTLRILLGHSSLRMVATYVATAEATNPDILKEHSIIDETKALGSMLANYTKLSVVRRTLTGKESKKHHKTSTLFMPTPNQRRSK